MGREEKHTVPGRVPDPPLPYTRGKAFLPGPVQDSPLPYTGGKAFLPGRVQDPPLLYTKRKAFLFALLVLFLCSVVGAVGSVLGYQSYSAMYREYIALAHTGANHLRTGVALLQTLPKKPSDVNTVQQAQQEFAAASMTFAQLDVHLAALPSFSTTLPVYGARLRSALRLLPVAINAAQLGMASCEALSLILVHVQNPFHSTQGLTMNDLHAIERDAGQVKLLFSRLTSQLRTVAPEDLQFDTHLGKLLATFNEQRTFFSSWLDEVEKLLPVLPDLLGIGHPAQYLIEMLDSSELRPGGGFIGNYGIATLSGGRLTEAHIRDVYLFDRPYAQAGHHLPFPAAYTWFSRYQLLTSWNLRDSNLDADFPTTAQNAERNYALEGGTVPVQGVIAITPTFISHVLKITGPISIPEYAETVTAQNLVSRIHYHQLGPGREGEDVPAPDGHSSVRKHFTELLAEHFLARMRQLPASALPTFLQVVQNAVLSRDVQLYFNAPIAEDVLHRTHSDGAIATPGSDSLFVVDANVGGDKANAFISNTMSDQVTLDATGNATHHISLNYAWLAQGNVYGNPLYEDYLRIYVPPGSILHMQSGWEPQGTSEAFGREVWAGFFTLVQGQTRTITLLWTVTHAAQKNTQVHDKSAPYEYQYIVQHQAGTRWMLHLQVALPPCVIAKNAGSEAMSSQVKKLDRVLSEDVSVEMGYRCG